MQFVPVGIALSQDTRSARRSPVERPKAAAQLIEVRAQDAPGGPRLLDLNLHHFFRWRAAGVHTT